MSSFKEFDLPGPIQSALEAMKFHTPTPIQEKGIPVAMAGRDLIGCARTGTGKTAAFCVPILARLMTESTRTALVLVPTRELALQIETFWRALTRGVPQMSSAVIIGGAAMQPQIRALSRRPRFLIATPGRLVDHLNRRTARLSETAFLVLDEADRMLDMGFAPQLRDIMKHVPAERQTLFFTATWASELNELAKRYLRNPERVAVDPVSSAAPLVEQSHILTTAPKKNETLLDELNRREGSVLVFARTKSRTDRVAKYLASFGVDVSRLHGGRSQGQRNAALGAFREGKVRVLIATDIAARGIDVVGIGHVINYDLPQCSEDYVHRIGRTGRAGAVGQAVSFVTPEDRSQWNEISRLIAKTGSNHGQTQSGHTGQAQPGTLPAGTPAGKGIQARQPWGRQGRAGADDRRGHRSGPRRHHSGPPANR